MRRKLIRILIFISIIYVLTGCNNQDLTDYSILETEINLVDKELFQCLENELGGYLVSENDELMEIPLSEIKDDNLDKIDYYRGVYASNNNDNLYVIVFPKNGTYEFEVMKDFDEYFYEKFSTYQKIETPFTPTIYIHSKYNDVPLKNIIDQCVVKKEIDEGKVISSEILNKLNNTSKIVIKTGDKELGEIIDNTKIMEILDAITSSKRYGDVCLSDGHAFDFEMYNNDKLIDTIYIWWDGKRLMPKSVNGCYYSISNEIDLRKVIEEETDYIFYNILNFRSDDKQIQQLIYSDGNYDYYLNSDNVNEILIKFMLNNKVMTLKYALENKYISAEKVSLEYPDILIKK